MLIKKFKAKSMQEALQKVKAEFGLDAMILNSREERPKGIKAIFSKPYFEITAGMAPSLPGKEKEARPAVELKASTREEFHNSMLEPLAREIKLLKQKVENLYEMDFSHNRPAPVAEKSHSRENGDDWAMASADIARHHSFESMLKMEEVAGLDECDLPRMNREGNPLKKSSEESRDELLAFAQQLRENGIENGVAETLVERLIPFIGRKKKVDALRKGLRQALESLVDFEVEERLEARRIIALVGPAGVGKTTTIAKLAASAAGQGKKVAVVTADSQKGDAARLMKKYAGKKEIAVNTATTPQSLAKALDNHRDKDIILLDTSGVSPDDHEAMEQLHSLLSASPEIERHLCLSSTTRDLELDETVRLFERYAIDRLIFTRMDESRTFGSIINVLLRSNLPLSYLTSGQNVTGSIEVATAGRLSELATGGKV